MKGFGGGNMQQLLKQAQQMQQQMQKAQKELEEMEITGSAGGELVSVTLTGQKQMVSVNIKPEAVDLDDLEMLEDLLVAAFNDALSKVEEISSEKLGPMAGAGAGLF
jgi:DNA-binding YbaB/EbfC family protein